MPTLDVSEVILDATIAGEQFTVQRREEVVSNNGESIVQSQYFTAFGSVTPTGDNSLVREEAFQVMGKTIMVITNFKLRGPSKSGVGNHFQPDIVWWNGDSFVVRDLSDFSNYGIGMVEAQCASIDLVDQNPQGPVAAAPEEDFTMDWNSDQAGGIIGGNF